MDPETAQRIERLEYQVAMLYRHLGLNPEEGLLTPPAFLPPPPYTPSPAYEPQDAVPGPPRDPRLPAEFFAAIAADKKIQAIKIYRQATGVGLKEAKDYVDGLDPRHHRGR